MIQKLLEGLLRTATYGVSLPERLVRSLSAGLGGMSKVVSDTLFPPVLRRSTSYRVFLGNFQRLLIEKIGRVEGVYQKDAPLAEEYVKRKLAGNAIEAVGILSVRLSPIWVFALASDAAGGGKVFLGKLVEELKREGVLAPESASGRIDSVESLLGAVQQASDRTTKFFDTPPLSVQELRESSRAIVGGFEKVLSQGRDLVPDFEAVWKQMNEISLREGLPLGQVSGLLAVSASRSLKSLRAAGKVTAEILYAEVLRSYQQTLDQIQKEGYASYFARTTEPFVKATFQAFDPATMTLTEQWLSRVWGLGGPKVQPPGGQEEKTC